MRCIDGYLLNGRIYFPECCQVPYILTKISYIHVSYKQCQVVVSVIYNGWKGTRPFKGQVSSISRAIDAALLTYTHLPSLLFFHFRLLSLPSAAAAGLLAAVLNGKQINK